MPCRLMSMILALLALEAVAQDSGTSHSISGHLSDGHTLSPIAGASCKIFGTDFGTATDKNGFFTIRHSMIDTILLSFSMVGYDNALVRVPPVQAGNTPIVYVSLWGNTVEGEQEYMLVPSDWELVNVGDKFSFQIPPEVVAKKVIGVDAKVSEYESSTLRVDFDDEYSVNFGNDLKNYSKVNTIIGCKWATVKSFSLPETSQFSHVVAVDVGSRFTFWVSYSNPLDQKKALMIAHSLRFP